MKFEITESPNSYLKIDFEKNEKIIVEKGCLMYSNGEYIFENKIEGGFKNLIAKVFGGKSLTFNVYTAKEAMEMAFSAKDTAEIFCIEIVNNNSILFNASYHFARSFNLDIVPGGMNEEFYVKTKGVGKLFLKGYGQIIEKDINTSKPIYIDEDSVIAYEEKLDAEWITGGMKKLLTSGDGELFMIKGQGKIWIQSKTKIEYKKDKF